MSDTVSCEDLSDEIIEDLKIKGLLNFVVFEQSSNSAITVMVYDNEKYRPLVREWGSAVGIHIFPPLDRRPFTDDLGKHSIRYVHTKVPLINVKANRKHFYFHKYILYSGPLSEIQPIKGFKWLGSWTITKEKGVTDDDGYAYCTVYYSS